MTYGITDNSYVADHVVQILQGVMPCILRMRCLISVVLGNQSTTGSNMIRTNAVSFVVHAIAFLPATLTTPHPKHESVSVPSPSPG